MLPNYFSWKNLEEDGRIQQECLPMRLERLLLRGDRPSRAQEPR